MQNLGTPPGWVMGWGGAGGRWGGCGGRAYFPEDASSGKFESTEVYATLRDLGGGRVGPQGNKGGVPLSCIFFTPMTATNYF